MASLVKALGAAVLVVLVGLVADRLSLWADLAIRGSAGSEIDITELSLVFILPLVAAAATGFLFVWWPASIIEARPRAVPLVLWALVLLKSVGTVGGELYVVSAGPATWSWQTNSTAVTLSPIAFAANFVTIAAATVALWRRWKEPRPSRSAPIGGNG